MGSQPNNHPLLFDEYGTFLATSFLPSLPSPHFFFTCCTSACLSTHKNTCGRRRVKGREGLHFALDVHDVRNRERLEANDKVLFVVAWNDLTAEAQKFNRLVKA